MSAPSAPVSTSKGLGIPRIAIPQFGHVGLLVGLAIVVVARWAITSSAAVAPVPAGLVFGIGLGVLAWLGGWRPTRPCVAPLLTGAVAGAALILLAVATNVPGRLPYPVAAFAPWVLVTALVASAEEAVLRGVLLDRLAEAGGVGASVVVTSLVFALMHVPFYGWHVLPLDLAVGVVFAGLRLGTGGVAAPAMAHLMADLATWWL